jgi:VTC domain
VNKSNQMYQPLVSSHDLSLNWRRELKLFLPARHKKAVLSFLEACLVKDEHVQEDHYIVKSLYYDSDVLGTYLNKKGGDLLRFKLRLRNYPGNGNNEQAFLEIKRRRIDIVWKERLSGKASQLHRFSTNHLQSGDSLPFESLPTLGKIHMTLTMRPKIYVEYHRIPYVSSDLKDFRVTVDGPIYIEGYKTLDQLATHAMTATDVLNGNYIVEFKFKQCLPAWFPILIRLFEMPVITYSKYVEGINYLLQTNPTILGYNEIKRIQDAALFNYVELRGGLQ